MADARKCKGCVHSRHVPICGLWCDYEKMYCVDRNKRGMCKYYEKRNPKH